MTALPLSQGRRRARLVEFVILYAAAPLAMATMVREGVVSARDMPLAFAILFGLSVLLLAITRGVPWRRILFSNPIPDWKALIAFIVIGGAGIAALTYWLLPWGLFSFPRNAPDLWLRVMIFYPLISVIPQAIIFLVLYFERYGMLFQSDRQAIIVNAVLFGLAHAFYLNPVAVLLSAAGGAAFAWAYRTKRSFWFANLLHAIGGCMVFTIGIGRFFYHGAI